MASSSRNSDVYIYNLPYRQYKDLCRILDRDNKWEELGGTYMNFDMNTIHDLRRDAQHRISPTEQLLTMWGQQNHTVVQLFVLLSKMHHYQAMLVLKPLVDSKFHPLIYEGEENLKVRLGKNKPTPPENSGQKPGGNASESAPPQNGAEVSTNGAPNNESPASSTPLLDKNMNVGMENLNVTGTTCNGPHDKELFPAENHVERKIINMPINAVSDSNNSAVSAAGAAAAAVPVSPTAAATPAVLSLPNPSAQPHLHEVAARPQAENKENNNPAPNSQRKMSNASDASSVAESCLTIPHLSYKELKMATNDWDKSTILGKGGFGTVFKGNWKNTLVAIKRIEQRGAESAESYQAQMEQSLRELRILNACRHDNILPLYGFSMGGMEPCLVYQFMPNGSLEDRLLCRQGTKPLSWMQRHNIAEGTARGLQFLHNIKKPFIHGDIKSANILLDNNFEPRIGDFGLAREGPQSHYTHMKVSRVHGTRPYLPDEFLRSKQMSTKVDTFSFGIVLFELATGQRAYDESRPKKLLKDHVENCKQEHLGTLCDSKAGTSNWEIFLHFISLGKRCVQQRSMRPEMEEVLKQLENMANFRRIADQSRHLVHDNSLNPSNQAMQDLSHVRKSSSPTLGPSGLPIPTPPLTFRVPSVSPEPLSHMMVMGFPMYSPYHHPQANPAVQQNMYPQRLIVPQEESGTSLPASDEKVPQHAQATPLEGRVHGNNIAPQRESGSSGSSMGNNISNQRTFSPTNLPNRPPVMIPITTSRSSGATIPIVKSTSLQPRIAVSPPSALQSEDEFLYLGMRLLPATIQVTSSSSSLSRTQGSEEGAIVKPPSPDCGTSSGLPWLSELGVKDTTLNDCEHEIAAQGVKDATLNDCNEIAAQRVKDTSQNDCKYEIAAQGVKDATLHDCNEIAAQGVKDTTLNDCKYEISAQGVKDAALNDCNEIAAQGVKDTTLNDCNEITAQSKSLFI